jgi:sulfonate transport system permease protein
LGAAWSAVLGAEFLGAQSGLGYIIVYSQSFGFLDRMFLVALLVIVYATLTYWLATVLFRRMNAWSNAG